MKYIHRHHSSKSYRQIAIAIITSIFLLFTWSYSDKYFLAKKLECYTQYGNCSPVILGNLSWLTGTHLLRPLPVSQVRKNLKTFVDIKNINLYRKLPNTLVLSLEMRKPIGMVGQQVLGTHVIADDEGFIIGLTDKYNYPLLLNSDSATLGGKLSQNQVNSLVFLGQMNSLSEGQLVGKIDGAQLTAYFPEDFTVLLDLSHITSNWYTTLQVILTRSKILSKIPKVIDLRYSSPIVTF
jgi:hypothetical protein